jgi:diguanylate cyclase (GGDEF)-like protein
LPAKIAALIIIGNQGVSMDIELKKFEQLKATGELPSPKGVALTIVRLSQRDDVSARQFEQAIKSDPAFVGRLMKAANIAGREKGRPIASVPDAVNVLGVSVVRNLALGFSLVSGHRAGACPNFDYPGFWSRAVVNALALQSIFKRTGWSNPEEAFCCGLLAEIGKLAFATLHPKEYSRLLGELVTIDAPAIERNALLREREIASFALHHDDLTAAMLTDWGFPGALLEPMYFRHCPERANFAPDSRGQRLLGAARLADAIADLCLAASELRETRLLALTERAVAIQLEPDVLQGIVDSVVHDWAEWTTVLQLDKPGPLPSFSEMMKLLKVEAGDGQDASQPALRVLIVDDETSMRMYLRAVLEQLGYQVFEAENGQQGLETALSVQPQIMIVDWLMPELDGLQLTRALRNTRLGREMYILMLTALGDEERLVEAFEAGADDYLSKPVNEKVLAARLRAASRTAQVHEEVAQDHRQMKQFAAELAVSNRRLHEASITDPLTGFHNRRYAMERLEQAWAVSTRNDRPVSCMMIDIDKFKLINDTYGHDVGDKVLTTLAEVLKKNLRANDVLCRIGGDEFLMISPDADSEAVRSCAQRMLLAVSKVQIETPLGNVSCSVSIGIATRNEGMVDMAMLLKAADEDMYREKIGGRTQLGNQPARV